MLTQALVQHSQFISKLPRVPAGLTTETPRSPANPSSRCMYLSIIYKDKLHFLSCIDS